MTSELCIIPVENESLKYVVWPPVSPLPDGVIQETKEYFFDLKDLEFPDQIEQANLYIDGQPLEALRSPSHGVARWKWSPGFHAGKILISIEVPTKKPETVEVITDPTVEKLTRADFTTMLRDILQDTHALFSLSGFRTGISKGDGRSVPPLARLEFLRSRFLEVEKTVKEICDRSVNVLKPRDRVVPLHKAIRITPKDYIRSLRSGRVLQTSSNRRLAVNHLPLNLHRTEKVSGVDIREHRDIKNRLKVWRAMLNVVEGQLTRNNASDSDVRRQEHVWAARCRVMARRLGGLLSLPLFSEVGEHTQPVTMTSIYRNIPVYGRFFRLHRDIESGISNILGDYLDLPLARTFDLYELWTFLRLVRAAIEMYGLKITPEALFEHTPRSGVLRITPENVIVDLNNGFGIVFKKRYREYWLAKDRVGSYSRTMEPDISLYKSKKDDSPPKLIVLDAKYRIKSSLNDAISSIHTYRDSIVEDDQKTIPSSIVIGAYLLSPHIPFYDKSWKKSGMPGRLFHPEYRNHFKFGAVSLYPGMSMKEVCECLENIINDADKTKLSGAIHG